MTYAEFSAELDTIYENINKNGAPGLDGYEKSVILTHAQELLVKETLKVDPTGSMFPQLIDIYSTSSPTLSTGFSWGTIFPAVSTANKGVFSILNEIVTGTVNAKDVNYTVIPINQVQFDRYQMTPYKYPPRRRAWRISELTSGGVDTVEIFPRPEVVSTLTKYKVRYIRKPKPIIVTDLQTLSPFALNVVSTYNVTTPGSGYAVGNIITLATGTVKPTFRVMTLSGGTGVATVSMLTNGYGVTTGANATTVTPAGGTNCVITVAVVNANTIDGLAAPQTSELDPGLHRDILKLASTLAEQYYYDKYGKDGAD